MLFVQQVWSHRTAEFVVVVLGEPAVPPATVCGPLHTYILQLIQWIQLWAAEAQCLVASTWLPVSGLSGRFGQQFWPKWHGELIITSMATVWIPGTFIVAYDHDTVFTVTCGAVFALKVPLMADWRNHEQNAHKKPVHLEKIRLLASAEYVLAAMLVLDPL